jgi:hypothetical protein
LREGDNRESIRARHFSVRTESYDGGLEILNSSITCMRDLCFCDNTKARVHTNPSLHKRDRFMIFDKTLATASFVALRTFGNGANIVEGETPFGIFASGRI